MRFGPDRHVGATMLDGLEGADRLAELGADVGIFNAHVAHRFADAEKLRGDEQLGERDGDRVFGRHAHDDMPIGHVGAGERHRRHYRGDRHLLHGGAVNEHCTGRIPHEREICRSGIVHMKTAGADHVAERDGLLARHQCFQKVASAGIMAKAQRHRQSKRGGRHEMSAQFDMYQHVLHRAQAATAVIFRQ